MYVRLGAALENLVLAVQAAGHTASADLLPEGPSSAHAASVRLGPGTTRRLLLHEAIPKRHTNRYAYVEGKEVPPAALATMASLAGPDTPSGRLFWFTNRVDRRRIGELLVAAAKALVADPDQSGSDFEWFRQDWDEIQRRRDGITVDAAGLPDVIASLAKLLPAQSREATDESWLNATRDRQTKTAAAYGIVAVRDASENRQRLEGGRLLERVHPWTTGNGLALGYPTHTPKKSPRRPVEAVLVS